MGLKDTETHLFPLWLSVIVCVLVVTGCGLGPTGLEGLQEWKYSNCFHGKRLWFVSMNCTNLKPQSQWYGSDDSAQRGEQKGKHHSRFCLFSFNTSAFIFRHALQPSGPSELVHTGPAGRHLISSFQSKRNLPSFFFHFMLTANLMWLQRSKTQPVLQQLSLLSSGSNFFKHSWQS